MRGVHYQQQDGGLLGCRKPAGTLKASADLSAVTCRACARAIAKGNSASFRRLVGNLHVSTEDDNAVTFVLAAVTTPLSATIREACRAEILRLHEANRRLYRKVMAG